MNEWANKGPILSALNFHRNLFTLLLLNQDILTNLGAGWLEHVPTFFQKLLIIFLLYFWDKNYYSPKHFDGKNQRIWLPYNRGSSRISCPLFLLIRFWILVRNEYRIVASTNTCYYSENQIFSSLLSKHWKKTSKSTSLSWN